MAVILADCRVDEALHESGNSIVYRARRRADNRAVILKVLNDDFPPPEKIAWFRREYEITRGLTPPGESPPAGVVEAHSLQTDQERWVMVLEDFGGQSLDRYLRGQGPLSVAEFLPLALQIVEALGQVHRQSIMHKDINPSNLVWNQASGRVKLIDFGIATVLSRENPVLRNPDVLEGTLAYISPEQTGRMNRAVDYRTDFYSLGVTFYELLTGQLPFPTGDAMALVHAHLARQPQPPQALRPEIPPPLAEIVLKLMAKNAEDRYQSAHGLSADLEECRRQWQEGGRIGPLQPGRHDISDRFQIPQKLYGREAEIETLLAAFDRASAPATEAAPGGVELMLVTGRAGIGKSALVQEIHKPVTRRRAFFSAGKFDQLQRGVPYASLAQAFRSLIRGLLTESEAQIAVWREELLAALGQSGQAMIDLIPDLALIIGPQPALPDLPPAEAQSRFHRVFQNFIRVFTRPEHPLVLFLDDLQWADAASLNLLQVLLTAPDIGHLFIIGAYRDDEVGEAHPLTATLAEIEGAAGAINRISLEPLDLPTIARLIADALHSSPETVEPLAELVQAKTNGNPFFVNEFLRALYLEGLLAFSPPANAWRWDLEKIRARQMTGNVVELMIDRVQMLGTETQQVLKLAACIGNRFDLRTLAVVYEKSPPETAADLWPAIAEGLVVPADETYKLMDLDVEGLAEAVSATYHFAHDRVQEAAYELISAGDRQAVHRQVGQLLLRDTPPAERELRIFDIVNQLNLGLSGLEEQAEKDALAELNLVAGRRAKASAAFGPAFNYLRAGLGLLAPPAANGADPWQRQYDLSLALHLETAEAAYLNADFAEMERGTGLVLERAATLLEKITAYEIKIWAYIAQNSIPAAVETGLQALKLLGIDLPAQPAPDDVAQGLEETRSLLAGKQMEDLAGLPEMTDPHHLAAARMLSILSNATYGGFPELYSLAIFNLVRLSVQHGHSSQSPTAYASYGLILSGVAGDVDGGYLFGQLGLDLAERSGLAGREPMPKFLFNSFIRHQKEHAGSTIKPLLEVYQTGQEIGAMGIAGGAMFFAALHAFWTGQEQAGLEADLAGYALTLDQINQKPFLYMVQMHRQAALNLLGRTEDRTRLAGESYDEAEMLPVHLEVNHQAAVNFLYLLKLFLSYLFQQHAQAVACADEAEKTLAATMGMVTVPIFYFYDSLARLALYPEATEAEGAGILERVAANQEKLEAGAGQAPTNLAHKYWLVEAERARLAGREGEARELYDRAIDLAREHKYAHEEALASELAARFYLGRGQTRLAGHYLRDARYAYQKWGATAKVADLAARYPQYLAQTAASWQTTATATARASSALDLTSVLKASQAISGEIVLDRLLATLMRIVIENAGAQVGYLIMPQKGRWLIEAEGAINEPQVTALGSIPVEGTDRLCAAIVNYVARTRESVVLNDASQEGIFTQDPYIVRRRPKSILCAPLIHQGELDGILYLENNLTPGAFTPDRQEILDLLSGQAAISIENANLYAHQVELTNAASRFVPHEFLQFLNKESLVEVELGDQVQLEMTILISDIRAFTTLSEKMTPQENFDFINAYLQTVAPVIRQHRGFIGKYMGDGIMAFFPERADDAVRASIEILRQVERYNDRRRARDRMPIRTGIGLHSGSVMLGTVGEAGRMQGDVMSDAANLAARLEGLTKFYGVSTVISAETILGLEDPDQYRLRFLGKVQVKGRQEAVSAFELFDADPPDIVERKAQSKTDFEAGLGLYYDRQFARARARLERVLELNPEDKAVQLYLERAAYYLANGVPDDWSGVEALTEK